MGHTQLHLGRAILSKPASPTDSRATVVTDSQQIPLHTARVVTALLTARLKAVSIIKKNLLVFLGALENNGVCFTRETGLYS